MTDHDREVVQSMELHGGHFVHALAQCCYLADDDNLARIKAAFHEYWAKYETVAAYGAPRDTPRAETEP